MTKQKSPRNKTITLSRKEISDYSKRLIKLNNKASLSEIINKTINQNLFDVLDYLPEKFVDLIIIDPPYNLTKTFNSNSFKERSVLEYAEWIESFISKLKRDFET